MGSASSDTPVHKDEMPLSRVVIEAQMKCFRQAASCAIYPVSCTQAFEAMSPSCPSHTQKSHAHLYTCGWFTPRDTRYVFGWSVRPLTRWRAGGDHISALLRHNVIAQYGNVGPTLPRINDILQAATATFKIDTCGKPKYYPEHD